MSGRTAKSYDENRRRRCARNVTNSAWVCRDCAWVRLGSGLARLQVVDYKAPRTSDNGLKIRVSVVRFRPWPPFESRLVKNDTGTECPISILFRRETEQ